MDRYEHFMVVVGEVCSQAGLGELEVRLAMADGSVVAGVPAVSTAKDTPQEADDTGWDRALRVGDRTVELPDVRELHLLAPR